MATKERSALRPAQVLLTDVDRDLARNIQRRLLNLGTDPPGPTTLYRAGLRALAEGDDDSLARAIGQAEERMDLDSLRREFEKWCRRIAGAVAREAPELKDVLDESKSGSFSYQGRFVVLSLMQDGRVLIGGLAAVLSPLQPGQPIPRSPQLFPGGLAVTISLNGEGAALATRAIVAFLLGRDDELDAIRSDFRAHQAQKLR